MSKIAPMPIAGTKVSIVGGPYKGLAGTVDSYHCGRLYCSLRKAGQWILAGPINPNHIHQEDRK
jgi:hypothetical protein